MLYLILPPLAWAISFLLLRFALGNRGFDVFFLHFMLIGIEGVCCFLFYRIFPIEGGYLAFTGFVGLHSGLLFLYAIGAAWRRKRREVRVRRKARPLKFSVRNVIREAPDKGVQDASPVREPARSM